MDATGSRSFVTSLGEQEQLIAARAAVQQRINEVRSNMMRLNNPNDTYNNPMSSNGMLHQLENDQGLQQFQTTTDLSRLVAQRGMEASINGLNNGNVNPLFATNIGNQNDFMALQDNFLQHQMRRNQVAEELELINQLSHQQAMMMELENRKQQQQRAAAAEHLLLQFSEVDNLVARQEMMNQAANRLGAISNVSHLPSLPLNLAMENQLFAQRLVSNQANRPSEAAQIMEQNNRQGNIAGLTNIANRGNLLSQQDILNLSLSTPRHNNLNFISTQVPSSIFTTNFAGNHAALLNQVASSQNKTNASPPTSVDLPHTIINNPRAIDNKDLPNIRYFNNGIEVQKNGKKKKKIEDKPKKKKSASKVKKESIAASVMKKQKTLPINKRTVKSAPLKKRRTFSSEEMISSTVPPEEGHKSSTKLIKEQKPGPHHDLMVEIFPSKQNKSKGDEDKMDAATALALLGFKTSP